MADLHPRAWYRLSGTVVCTSTLLACLTPLCLPKARATPVAGRTVARYIVEPLDGGPGPLTPRAINDSGQIAGSIERSDGSSHAFLWQGGKLKLLPALGGANSGANAINSRGQIAGFAETRDRHGHPVVWYRNTVRAFDRRPGKEGTASGINDQGEIVVGLTDVGSTRQRGFVYRNGRLSSVRVQRGFYLLSADAINSRGVIAGRLAPRGIAPFDHAVVHVCLVKNGRAVRFGPATNSNYAMAASAINDHDTVVGGISYVEGFAAFTIKNGKYDAAASDDYHAMVGLNNRGQYVGCVCGGSVIQDGPYYAILWENGQKYNLNKLIPENSGWVLQYANAINNRGEIVGTGTYQGRPMAFRLIPRTIYARTSGPPVAARAGVGPSRKRVTNRIMAQDADSRVAHRSTVGADCSSPAPVDPVSGHSPALL